MEFVCEGKVNLQCQQLRLLWSFDCEERGYCVVTSINTNGAVSNYRQACPAYLTIVHLPSVDMSQLLRCISLGLHRLKLCYRLPY